MRCRLYLATPPELTSGTIPAEAFLEEKWRPALSSGDVAAMLIRTSREAEETVQRRIIEDLVGPAQEADAAVVLEYRADWAVEMGCDGVHLLADAQNVKSVRRALGEDMIVGAACGGSRHLAMQAGEAGADYVCFGELEFRRQSPDPEVIQWWSELMEIPCVALGGITLESAAPLIEAGADFLCVGTSIWEAPGGAVQAVAAFDALIREMD